MEYKKPELVAPSGDWGSLHSAAASGADAVYFGVKDVNMRHFASNFDILQIKKVMDFFHERGKRGYLALNVTIYDDELDKIKRILDEAASSDVDAVILWDMAVFTAAKQLGLKIHLSTQASVSNFEAVKFYASLGTKRIVLARECALSAVKDIIQRVHEENIDCGIETFIHGAMCVSISGRCFLSHHSFAKSANRGECIQPCRREFTIIDQDKECRYELGKDYILSAKDLCAVGFIDELITSGVDAFKIEGRMRSPEYVSVATSAYRTAIDAFFENKLTDELKRDLLEKLKSSFNRGFSNGFYFGVPDDTGGKVKKEYEKVYLGEVTKFYKKISVAEIFMANGDLQTGQKILITGDRTPAGFTRVKEMQIDHKPVDFTGKGAAAGVKLPFPVRPKDKVFLWKHK